MREQKRKRNREREKETKRQSEKVRKKEWERKRVGSEDVPFCLPLFSNRFPQSKFLWFESKEEGERNWTNDPKSQSYKIDFVLKG